jgi:hypothetical protein
MRKEPDLELKTIWMRRHQKEQQTKRGQKDIVLQYTVKQTGPEGEKYDN